ncbi:serine/threonine-protein kinase Nek6-like [Gigantopelta aegis]|uniref:serine/threonine-protein kinase Nek6-like n=1 Tax=Gigantopelta aegis TaxID=1735272 RepID=UPI001B88D54E|nr:serine/threonine-protein kinase Nek6-like [Gigantopelta aegis]XP_041375266.1 serine/threonine-protein kinase Nek6-like [Gigantopelta aegis]XP_041375267.1 serine/threonine-protein kinase Nek6-like [Gigantopelta aegis]XP_041375268.1 serine/threonine-protein kinase Nek6-like [Gigantopelta aegis]
MLFSDIGLNNFLVSSRLHPFYWLHWPYKCRNMMYHIFNPISQTITIFHQPKSPPSLQQCSRQAVLAAITLKGLDQAMNLPLPSILVESVSNIHLDDFLIKLEDLCRENYITRTYPATCLFNKHKVFIKVILPGKSGVQLDTSHPSYLTVFGEQGYLCCVYNSTDSLQDKIARCIKDGESFEDTFVWRVIHAVCSQLVLTNPRPDTKIKPSVIIFLAHNKIFLDVKETEPDEEDITFFNMGLPEPIYDAPEVITHNNPDSTAFVWSLGCILYELLCLEPAFFDIEGINPFQMYMDIVQGELPSFQNLQGSTELKDLTSSCMRTEPGLRPTLEYLVTLSKSHIPGSD